LCTFAAVIAAALAGCGDGRPTRVPVSGMVLIDGKPLAYGSIMFINDTTRPAGSGIDADGRFTLSCYEAADGAIKGKHRVKITAAQPYGENAVRWLAPKKYANEKTSGLEAEVTEATNEMTFKLSWDGKKPFVER
jgi:hypothetical protein